MSLEFEKLAQQNIGRIRRIAQRYAAFGEAEDLSQEILMELWRSFDSFRGDSKMETWVYRVAFNTAMTSLRRNIRKRDGEAIVKANSVQAEGTPSGYSEADILSEFLQSLNEVDASVLMMYLDGIQADEMERVLGVSANAINVRISRIKNKFSERYVS